MRTLKRVVVLLVELLVEALLLGSFFGAMVANQVGILNGILSSVIAVPVILGLHGYYVFRPLAAFASVSNAKWLYPAVAGAVFVASVLFIALQAKTDLSAQAQAVILPFLAGGACLVFACSFAGNQLFRKWLPSADGPGLEQASSR